MSRFVQECQNSSNNIQNHQEKSDSGIFMMPLFALVTLGLVSQPVSTAGAPQPIPFYVNVTCGVSLCILLVPGVHPLSLCYLVPVTDFVACPCDIFCNVKVMDLICCAKHN